MKTFFLRQLAGSVEWITKIETFCICQRRPITCSLTSITLQLPACARYFLKQTSLITFERETCKLMLGRSSKNCSDSINCLDKNSLFLVTFSSGKCAVSHNFAKSYLRIPFRGNGLKFYLYKSER